MPNEAGIRLPNTINGSKVDESETQKRAEGYGIDEIHIRDWVDPDQVQKLMDDFLESLNPGTKASYRSGIDCFTGWHGKASSAAAITDLLEGGSERADQLLRCYSESLGQAGDRYAPATVNGKLSVLRSLLKMARIRGLIGWKLSTRGVRLEQIGGSVPAWTSEMENAMWINEVPCGATGLRDYVLFRLYCDSSLSYNDLEAMNTGDFWPGKSLLAISGGIQGEYEFVRVNEESRKALLRWLAEHPLSNDASAPLFAEDVQGVVIQGVVRRMSVQSIQRAIQHGWEMTSFPATKFSPYQIRRSILTNAVEKLMGNKRYSQRLPAQSRFSHASSAGVPGNSGSEQG